MYFGAHIDVSKGLLKETKRVLKFGGNMVQLFLTTPGYRKVSKKTEPELMEFKKFMKENKIKCVVHGSYILNLARDWDYHSWWLKNLQLELQYANKIDAIGVVVHFGHQMKLSKRKAMDNMYTSILQIINKTKNIKTKIILETSSGQGTEMCYTIEDMSKLYKRLIKIKNMKERIGLCIDTCHVFAAGYDLRTKNTIDSYLKQFDKYIGLDNVSLIHMNDSKVKLGEKKDRHDNIGKGFIGYIGLRLIFKLFYKKKIPIILETPYSLHKKDFKLLMK